MLKAIEAYIRVQKIVTQKQLEQVFEMEASAIEPMILFLLARKVIKEVDAADCGQQCTDCDEKIYYQWTGFKKGKIYL